MYIYMRKISGIVDKSYIDNEFSNDITSLFKKRLQLNDRFF